MNTNNTVEVKKFGTFLGVFLPSILTVLGLIMYLRFGWVVGNLGLGLTIAVVVLANVITFISGLSASAIATNIKVGVGGVYYLVSRSLGLETGGAIGVAFYISRTLSVTFYCFGLAESVLLFWPEGVFGLELSQAVPLLTAILIILITFLAGRSAAMMLKMQVPMLILVGLSILALIIGVLSNGLQAPEWGPSYRTEPGGFWVIFAVFFPGVTGFLAGIAMSGELKDPGKSIPHGTIASVLTGLAVYLLIPVLLAVSAVLSYDQIADPEFGIKAWTSVALFGGLIIYPAAWGAIFSSAVGSMLSGPRVLQSLSMDGLAPKFLSRVSKTGQPQVATWVTGAIALAAVALGELNTVAKFVTVLFLTLYVVINLVAAIEKLVAEPSYRPKINIPWYVSMAGAIGALFVMYLISPGALVLAIGLELACYIYFKKKALEQSWGDVNAGFWVKVARFALLRMNESRVDSRNWRPMILLFVRDIRDRMELVKLAAAFGQNRGVLTISKLISINDRKAIESRVATERQMQRELQPFGVAAFCEVNAVQTLQEGILDYARGHGVGALRTNTVIFGFAGESSDNAGQLKIIRDLGVAGKNILLVKFNKGSNWQDKHHENIHIWWGGQATNGDLMLILAYMLQLNREWSKATITISAVVEAPEQQVTRERSIRYSLAEARIQANVQILLKGEEGFTAILHRESAAADIVFMGLQHTDEGQEYKHAQKLESLAQAGKIVVFTQNNSSKEALPHLLQ